MSTMKSIPILLVTGVLALAGCSSTPTHVGGGPIHASTFSYVNTGLKPAPGYADDRAPIHSMIQSAITKSLASRGLTQVATGGEVTVAYLIITGNNASTASINDYFGYGDDATALHEKAHAAYTGSKNPNYFEAGTLLIDLIDSKSYKLLKRGYATRPILRNIPDDARAARIQEVADEILRDVRVAP
jgi:hypothetical protein